MDSESKNSFIGSFLQPPDWRLPASFVYMESKKLAAAAADRPSLPNNQAVVAALRALQEKIHRLELEKSQAEDKLCSLSRAAAQYKKVLEHKSYQKDEAYQELMQQRRDSNAVQSRCSLLEKQLDYMRKMVSSAELEKKMILEQQAQLQKEEDQNQLELHAKLEKLEMLEKEYLKITATQRITELQTGFDINRILMSSVTSQHEPEKENGKNKKPRKRNPTMKKMQLPPLHVKAGELPFVAGKSASSSHSVSANVQSVLHIMKHRNPCISSRGQGGATAGISGHSALSKSVSFCSTSPTATRSFSDLLLAFQDELGKMSSEHQELLKQIQETQDSQAHEDLEQELDCLVKQMEMKGKQISKLKKHQATVQKLKRKTQNLKQGATHVKLKCGEQKEAKEIAVTVKESMSKPFPGQKSRSSLQLLKAVRKLQLSLKKDDVI
ncbi:centrosomal protein CEP57L1 isoform X2 [Ammospiza nelsoni]|uniref:centrosomal protein CEP57L1 isoform X2 n=1 Tax=Ammospiza caudacuta TaxID=2857398 RepID=UPI002739B997|nr:centrosomal protein CEP57L1 isoform X2 [Ammospiza caudacuta]XP_059324391.1 centrosomal protein CEP57L1 isoform X2 [Ammospiza nelsoni]